MQTQQEHVVLVDDHNNVLGTAPKAEVHTGDTPLHRAFSCFLFNNRGQLLLQQRSHIKKTWPLVWSNSVCGHPALHEDNKDAVLRRMKDELCLDTVELFDGLPDYRYRAEKDGIVENEICPVYVGFTNQEPTPNPEEVEATKWVDWQEFVTETTNHPDDWSPWCVEETQLLHKSEAFTKLFEQHKKS